MEYGLNPDCLSPFSERELDSIKTPIPLDNRFFFPPDNLGEEECFNTSLSLLEDFCQNDQKVEKVEPLPQSDKDVCFTDEEDALAIHKEEDSSSSLDSETKIVIRIDHLGEGPNGPQLSGNSETPSAPVALPRLPERKAKQGRPRGPKKGKKKVQVINSHNLKRHDVVLKSILRRMRRYLYSEFLLVTKFKKTEKQHKIRMASLIRGANAMTNHMDFPIQPSNYSFYYLALACPGELKKLLNDTHADEVHKATIERAFSVVNLIENVLNRFSKKIFKHFMEIPEVSALVQNYLNSEDYLEDCEGFEPCISLLDEKSKEVISDYADNPNEFSLNPYWIKEPFFVFQN